MHQVEQEVRAAPEVWKSDRQLLEEVHEMLTDLCGALAKAREVPMLRRYLGERQSDA